MKTVNEVKNAYTFYLEKKMPKIYGMWKSNSIPIESMRKNIKSYIVKATYQYTDACGNICFTRKKDFVESIDTLQSKEDIYWRCFNAVRCAKNIEARTK